MDFRTNYNEIQDVEIQNEKVKALPIESLQDSLFDIFNEHDAQHDFGLALVHRHYDLHPGHIMVHSRDEQARDVCRAEQLGKRDVYPRSYHIHQGEFVPYEFSSDPLPRPSATFMSEMAVFLTNHQYHNTIGITYIPRGKSCWIETMSRDQQATVATPLPPGVKHALPESIITEWAFWGTGAGARMVPSRVCKQLDNGGHKVID